MTTFPTTPNLGVLLVLALVTVVAHVRHHRAWSALESCLVILRGRSAQQGESTAERTPSDQVVLKVDPHPPYPPPSGRLLPASHQNRPRPLKVSDHASVP